MIITLPDDIIQRVMNYYPVMTFRNGRWINKLTPDKYTIKDAISEKYTYNLFDNKEFHKGLLPIRFIAVSKYFYINTKTFRFQIMIFTTGITYLFCEVIEGDLINTNILTLM